MQFQCNVDDKNVRRLEMYVNQSGIFAYLNWVSGKREISYSVDGKPAITYPWSRGERGSYFAPGVRVEEIARSFLDADMVVVTLPRLTDVGEERQISFRVAGFREAAKPVFEAC